MPNEERTKLESLKECKKLFGNGIVFQWGCIRSIVSGRVFIKRLCGLKRYQTKRDGWQQFIDMIIA